MKEKIIKMYIDKLTKQDIINYINKNKLSVTNNEIDLIYNSVKQDYIIILNNPINYLNNIKDKLSISTYNKLLELYTKYYHLL